MDPDLHGQCSEVIRHAVRRDGPGDQKHRSPSPFLPYYHRPLFFLSVPFHSLPFFPSSLRRRLDVSRYPSIEDKRSLKLSFIKIQKRSQVDAGRYSGEEPVSSPIHPLASYLCPTKPSKQSEK